MEGKSRELYQEKVFWSIIDGGLKPLEKRSEVYQLAMKELCDRCGKETKYDASTPITIRRYFIEGAGQLCEECWTKLWPDESITPKEKSL